MVRETTEEELNYINTHYSEKALTAEDIYMLDAVIANNYRLTTYFYYLGATSLHNFVNDLADTEEPQKFLVNHRENIPLGTWLSGVMKKDGEGYAVEAPVFMVKGLEAGGYSTDNIIKAYNAGHLTDVSVYWVDGDPMCDICGLDIRNPDCPHMPGQEYEGVMATCTIENAHLGGEISGVWKGGLPGAKFKKGKLSKKKKKDAYEKEQALDWKNIKETGLSGQLKHILNMPIQQEEESMTYKEAKKEFEDELADEFVLKTEHDETVDGIKKEHNQLVESKEALEKENKALKSEKEKGNKEIKELTNKFADTVVELETKRILADKGAKVLEDATKECHRLGVALHADKWDTEAKQTQINALTDEEKFKFLEAEIKLLTDELEKKFPGQRYKPKDDKGKKDRSVMDNEELYKTR